MSASELQRVFMADGYGPMQVTHTIRALVAEGVVEGEGVTRGRRYRCVSALVRELGG